MDYQTIISILLVFFFASFLKGITGLGFSTICLPILTSFVDLKISIPLVILPSLSSNALVMAQAGRFKESLGRFWLIYTSAIPGLFFGVYVLNAIQSSISRAILGAVLIVYAMRALSTKAIVLPRRYVTWLASPVGFTTGFFVNGVTGSQVVPVLPFLLSLRLNKDFFVQAINFSFTLSSIMMFFLLGRVGLLTSQNMETSLIGIIPAAIGIFLGGKLRRALPEETFRKVVLIFLFVIGFSLIIRIIQ